MISGYKIQARYFVLVTEYVDHTKLPPLNPAKIAAKVSLRLRFSSVRRNDMIMNTPMDINSGMMVFHGYNVRFYDCLCATDDWLVLLELPSEYNP